MSIMDTIFGTAAPAPAPAPAQTAAPAAAPTPAPAPASQNPELDIHSSLWQTPTDKDGKPIQHNLPDLNAPIFTPDPTKIADSVKNLDFTKSLDPAMVQKALQGDVTAFADVINAAMRQAVIVNSQVSGNLVNQAVISNNNKLQQTIPTAIRQVQLQQLPASNPALEHPSVAPLVQSLRQMAFSKDPNANPAAVQAQIENYLISLAGAINGSSPEAKAAAEKATATAKSEDWGAWYETPPAGQ